METLDESKVVEALVAENEALKEELARLRADSPDLLSANEGSIHKITVGDPMVSKTAYYVTQEVRIPSKPTFVVTRIIHDRNYFHTHGIRRYLIYGKPSNSAEFLFISFENLVSVSITYDVPSH